MLHLDNDLHSFLSALDTPKIVQQVSLLLLLHPSRVKVIVVHVNNMGQREDALLSRAEVDTLE